ncbi:MAG: TatD family hydrolase, partial [Planctomycetota bacterium]
QLGKSVYDEAKRVGVNQMVAIGIDLASSYQCCQIAEQTAGIYASVGIHPNSCHQANGHQWAEIIELSKRERVVAIGETGLDCYWDDCPLPTQKDWFIRHIQFSHESGLPLVVHQRESENEILDVFADHHLGGKINGIMHSFTGSWETAKRCLDYGMFISFAGMITFKNADAIREVAKKVPLDRILVETDSPYLTPVPHRGKRPNQPSMVRHTAEFISDLLSVSFDDFAAATTHNAMSVFDIKKEVPVGTETSAE